VEVESRTHRLVEQEDIYPRSMAGLESRIGVTELSSSDWEPLERPIYLGFLFRNYLAVEPLELEVGGSYSYDREGGGVTPLQRLRLYELDLGLGVSTPLGPPGHSLLEPFFGAGLALVMGRSDVAQGGGIDYFEDADNGYYLHGGVRLYVERRQYISIDWRWLRGADLDLGYGRQSVEQRTLSIGFGFSF